MNDNITAKVSIGRVAILEIIAVVGAEAGNRKVVTSSAKKAKIELARAVSSAVVILLHKCAVAGVESNDRIKVRRDRVERFWSS